MQNKEFGALLDTEPLVFINNEMNLILVKKLSPRKKKLCDLCSSYRSGACQSCSKYRNKRDDPIFCRAFDKNSEIITPERREIIEYNESFFE